MSESNWNVLRHQPFLLRRLRHPAVAPRPRRWLGRSDWRTNPATQIEWGLAYIQSRYGSPCSAWYFKQGNNWY